MPILAAASEILQAFASKIAALSALALYLAVVKSGLGSPGRLVVSAYKPTNL